MNWQFVQGVPGLRIMAAGGLATKDITLTVTQTPNPILTPTVTLNLNPTPNT